MGSLLPTREILSHVADPLSLPGRVTGRLSSVVDDSTRRSLPLDMLDIRYAGRLSLVNGTVCCRSLCESLRNRSCGRLSQATEGESQCCRRGAPDGGAVEGT